MKDLAVGPVLPFVLALLAAACGSKVAVPGESASARTVASLIPPDAVLYARVTSLDALLAMVQTAGKSFAGASGAVSREDLLGGLGPMAGDTSQIDGARTIGFALSAPRGTRPLPLVFVPVKDGAKYAASLRAAGVEAVVADGYAVLPLGGTYTKPGTPSSIADAMPAGLVAVRADVVKAEANLGVVIRSGIDVFQRQMAAQMRAAAGGFDGEAMAEGYATVAKVLLAAGTTLDLAIDEKDGLASMNARYVAKPGSELDGWSSPPVDLSAFAGKLGASAAVDFVGLADWTKLWPKVESMMGALFDMYPPALRGQMQKLMQVYPAVYSRLGPIMLGSVDFTDGLRFDMHIAPPDGAALLAEMDALLKRPELADLGMTFTAGAANAAGDATVRDYKLVFDPTRLAGVASDDEQAKVALKQMTDVMQAVFGTDGVPMQMAVAKGRGVIRVGKAGGDLAKALAPASGTWPASLQPALAATDGCNPLFLERIDFAAVMRAMGAFMPAEQRRAMPMPGADAKAQFVVGGGVRGAEWRAFLSMDLAGFGAMVRATQPR